MKRGKKNWFSSELEREERSQGHYGLFTRVLIIKGKKVTSGKKC